MCSVAIRKITWKIGSHYKEHYMSGEAFRMTIRWPDSRGRWVPGHWWSRFLNLTRSWNQTSFVPELFRKIFLWLTNLFGHHDDDDNINYGSQPARHFRSIRFASDLTAKPSGRMVDWMVDLIRKWGANILFHGSVYTWIMTHLLSTAPVHTL